MGLFSNTDCINTFPDGKVKRESYGRSPYCGGDEYICLSCATKHGGLDQYDSQGDDGWFKSGEYEHGMKEVMFELRCGWCDSPDAMIVATKYFGPDIPPPKTEKIEEVSFFGQAEEEEEPSTLEGIF